ncbi:MAG TPA: hypothetical protein VFI47_11470 [Acidimicrobiales bacterium]|nr:hypothetical protein [Acidimicrobiales bacterium]
MTENTDVPPEILTPLRSLCLGLPETYEEEGWVGVRWLVATRTFAHVLVIDAGWPPAYARAAGTDGPATVLTCRSSGPELDALGSSGPPWFRARWGRDMVGLVLEGAVDWDDVAELVTESYRFLAPQRLAAQVTRPPG